MNERLKLFSWKERVLGLLVAAGVSCAAGYTALVWQYSAEHDTAETKAHNQIERIYSRLAEISGATASLRTLYRVSVDNGSDEFEQYTSDLIAASETISAIGRFDRIHRDDLQSFTSLMSERGIYRFRVKSMTGGDLSSAHEYHNAVSSVNPFTPGLARLIGADLSGDQALMDAIQSAASANEPVLAQKPDHWSAADALLFIPTYAGRYTPRTSISRISQTNGGYFLTISFESLLAQTEDLYSNVSYGGKTHRSAASIGNERRALKGMFHGYRVELTPSIGESKISIVIGAPDGVSSAAVVLALVWVIIAIVLMTIALALVFNHRTIEHRRRAAQRSLESERKIALTTLEAINDSVFTVNDRGVISYVNPAAEAMTEKVSENILGTDITTAIPFINSEATRSGLTEIQSKLSTGKSTTLNELELLTESNCTTQVDCTFTPFIENDLANGGVLVMRDVGQERDLNKKLQHLATHDALTGLVNRYYFELRLEELVKGASSLGESHAICYVDMDQFKVVNDTCGHQAGDRLLIQVANHLKETCRPMDVLARLGGDEFGILIRSCDESECEAIAKRIHDTFQAFYFISGEHKFAVRACIGFAMINKSYDHISDVMAAADIACYSAKDKGRNELHIFRPECEETSQRQGELLMLPKLQNALTVDNFVLFVQPIAVILDEGYDETTKYEILLRMVDDNGSLITPHRLISAAERYDLMKEVDRWVIGRALREVAELHKIYGDALPMFSINLSGQSVMDSDIISYILSKFGTTDVPPEKICFEITETSAMGDMTRALALLDFLHEIGCKVALDDFGAGECSFGYLKQLPVDYLKVDGQFVKDVDTCDVHKEMLRFVQRVAGILDMKTVAEFVENESIMNCLREMGIDYAQGYHISKPFNISELKNQYGLDKAA